MTETQENELYKINPEVVFAHHLHLGALKDFHPEKFKDPIITMPATPFEEFRRDLHGISRHHSAMNNHYQRELELALFDELDKTVFHYFSRLRSEDRQ